MRLIGTPSGARTLRVRLVAPDGSVHLPISVDRSGELHFDTPIANSVVYVNNVALAGTPTPPDAMLQPLIRDRQEFAAALQRLRLRSGLGLREIARACSRPPTTVHGWFAGRHLPYPRDTKVFMEVLRQLGVEELQPWQEALTRLRRSGSTNSRTPA